MVVLTFEPEVLATLYAEQMGLPWPVVSDPERLHYDRWQMDRAGLLDVWGPRTWWAYVKELLGGARLKPSGADTAQRGGNVLIDPEGRVHLHHVGTGPADRPSVQSLIAIVGGATTAG